MRPVLSCWAGGSRSGCSCEGISHSCSFGYFRAAFFRYRMPARSARNHPMGMALQMPRTPIQEMGASA